MHPARNEAEGIAALFRGFQAAAGRKKDAVSVNNRINQRFLSSHLMKRRIRGAVYLLRRPSRRATSFPPCGVLPAVRRPSRRAVSVPPCGVCPAVRCPSCRAPFVPPCGVLPAVRRPSRRAASVPPCDVRPAVRCPSRRAASVPPCGVLPAVRCPSCRAPSVQPFASQVHFPRQGAHGAGSAPGIAFAARVFPPGGFNKSEAGRTQRKNSAAGRRATRFSCSGASFGLSRRLTGRFHL